MTMPTGKTSTSDRRYDRFRQEVVSGGTDRPKPADEDAIGGTWAGRLAALVIVSLFVWLAFVNAWMFLFAMGILVSVFLHETGHFVTARLTGMKATQFFLGFGPRMWSFRRGETEYGARLLPLGAFVKIIGMSRLDDVPLEDEARTYRQQSYPKRMLVISAGSLMHMLIAVVLLFSVFSTRGQMEDVAGAEIGALSEQGPAETAGLRVDDRIVAIDGQAVADPEALGALVRGYDPGEGVEVTVLRDGEPTTIDVVLGANTDRQSEYFGAAMLGVSSAPASEWQPMSIGRAAVSSVTEVIPVTWESTKGVVKVLNPVNIWAHLSGESDDLATRPTTVVGVTQVSATVGENEGLVGVIYLLAVLNVFVGVFNMFPLLPLDGGHAAVATYERIREGRTRRRYFADVERLMPFAMGVIAVLLVLFMAGFYLDISEPLR
jgi:membrane-associated protease RseP (regulator of RpoE activity)